ncbi:MAG: TetR/AcrR family transcriptional regulator [Proteobacteria bacterium]|nr:TetR/AcrR family transcriptional regulator [Pseudomonadota bacterium]
MGILERRKREKELRQELAISAAMAIYDEEGYHAITMDRIAERSELSRAALYLYFKSKEEILIKATVSFFDDFAALLQGLYDNREKNKYRLFEDLWGCFKQIYEKNPSTFAASQYVHHREIIRNLPEDLRNILFKSGAKVVGLQHMIVEYGVKEGVFIEVDSRTLSEVIWASFLGIVYLERSKNTLSKKNHLSITHDLALMVLAKGILNQPQQNH